MVDGLETSFWKGIGISQRKLADLQFQSLLYQLLELLRQRELTDLQSCKDLYETYYQSTICLFGYLQICQESIDVPSLDIGRTSDIFRCMIFVVLGPYGHLKETQGSLERKILENAGIVLSNTDIINRSDLRFLSHHYCVLPNSKCIDTLVRNTPGTQETLVTKAVCHTTLGNWIYLKAEFITNCVKKNMLMDPKDYTFELDATARAKLRNIRFQNIAPQLQRQSQPLGAGSIPYHTAIRKYKTAQRALKKKFNSVD